jgi:predicted dehydrogenase
LFEDEGTTCVFIATRHNLHARLAADALRSGKDVFVEKPLATSRDDLNEVITAARESQRLLMVGYNRRFSELASRVKAAFRNRRGPMTIVYRVNAGQLPAGHWALDPTEGGGRIIGEVCHFVDFIQYLTGSLPVFVTAEVAANDPGSGFQDDSAVISLSMRDGSVATIVYAAGGDDAYQKERIEVFCDQTVAVIEDFRRAELVRQGRTSRYGGRGQDKGHRKEVDVFLEAVRSGGALPIDLESMAATSLVCLGALESARSGKGFEVDVSAFSS